MKTNDPSVESIAVGTPRAVVWNGQEVLTSVFKAPVPGPVMVRRHNLDGDRQSDLEVHGGEFKAVYAYDAGDYHWWRKTLGRVLEPASFGENLALRGLDFAQVALGDVFRIGVAELEAVGPRLPCFKLGIRFGDPGVIKTFAQSRRWGIYFRVGREGQIAVGDAVTLIRPHPRHVPVYDLARVYVFDHDDAATMERLLGVEGLDPSWKAALEKRRGGG